MNIEIAKYMNKLGIIINKMPPISKPQRRIEKITIPGKNGVLYQDDKSYEPIIAQIACTIIEKKFINVIKQWLNGEGKFILSTMPDRYYNARIINQIDYTDIARKIYEFPLQIELQPISYGVKEKELNIKKESQIIITDSTYLIKPYIKIEGKGDITLTVNNKSVILKNITDYIELDCELEEAYKDIENCNNKINCIEFPTLMPGKNDISFLGNVSNIQIKYREAYI